MADRWIEVLRRVVRRLLPDFHPLRHPFLERLLMAWIDFRRPEVLATRHGFDLRIPKGHRSPVVLDLHLYGEYEPEETRLLLEHLRGTRLAFDVGANVGYTVALMAQAMDDPEARIHAFEPEPANLAILRDNVERLGLGGVVTSDLALSSTSGEASLFLAADNLGDHTMVALPGRRAATIRTVTFDEYWLAHCAPRRVDFVKIDVQGHELEVLRGMRESLHEGRIERLLFEFWPARIRAQGGRSREVAELLAELPYESRVVSDTGGGEYRTLGELCRDAEKIESDPHRFFNVLLARR